MEEHAPLAGPILLSPEQEAVVSHRGTHLQVVACAGSGKTEAISRRVAGLIEEGVEPSEIIAFTFTERAAAALKDRITKRVAESKGGEFLDRLGAHVHRNHPQPTASPAAELRARSSAISTS